MLKEIKADFKCVLHDKKTGKDLFEFDAQQVGDPVYTAGFEGGGVASGNQSLTIATDKEYAYKAHQHHIIIDERKWIITSVTPSIRRRLGAGFGAKPRVIYILGLE